MATEAQIKYWNSLRGKKPKNITGLILGHGWNRGIKATQEQKEKLRLLHLGMKHSEDTKKRIGDALKGIVRSNVTRKKMSAGQIRRFQEKPMPIGEKHWSWKGENCKKKEERNDSAYQRWRMSVWIRDGFRCRIANGDCEGRIIAHHILPWRSFVELRYEINNGVTLCQAHHPRKRAEEKRLIPFFNGLVSASKELI